MKDVKNNFMRNAIIVLDPIITGLSFGSVVDNELIESLFSDYLDDEIKQNFGNDEYIEIIKDCSLDFKDLFVLKFGNKQEIKKHLDYAYPFDERIK